MKAYNILNLRKIAIQHLTYFFRQIGGNMGDIFKSNKYN